MGLLKFLSAFKNTCIFGSQLYNHPMEKRNHHYIDATGLNCPIPLMLLKKAMEDLPIGALVTIDVTDEHAELDFETWCDRFGHQMEAIDVHSNTFQFQITKGSTN